MQWRPFFNHTDKDLYYEPIKSWENRASFVGKCRKKWNFIVHKEKTCSKSSSVNQRRAFAWV